MKKMVTFLLGGIFFLTSCVSYTPLSQNEIDKLIHCNITIKKAKKNLIISGYGIQNADEETIVTDYKQVYNSQDILGQNQTRILRRLSIVKISQEKIKIIPRFKQFHSRTTTSSTSTSLFSESGQITNEIESEPAYFKENIQAHEQIIKEVCGS